MNFKLLPDGSFHYDHDGSENFKDFFVYSAEDGQTKSPPTLVTIDVRQRVDIDVKPGGDPNSVNVSSRGVIPVTLLGTKHFDVEDAMLHTVQFAGASLTDAAFEDVDGDGDTDLVMHFRTQESFLKERYEEQFTEDLADDGMATKKQTSGIANGAVGYWPLV